ncbi:hypothetical protein U9M48_032557 [Paspalum notatum var. saurae]|uniref:ATP-dependent RNA helicase DHX29-like UBA domain-containing protein n=1 Tax=Paspalum notatum var. saurae TaxID=547442 RepID=A0AAQ3X5W4_PASNO
MDVDFTPFDTVGGSHPSSSASPPSSRICLAFPRASASRTAAVSLAIPAALTIPASPPCLPPRSWEPMAPPASLPSMAAATLRWSRSSSSAWLSVDGAAPPSLAPRLLVAPPRAAAPLLAACPGYDSPSRLLRPPPLLPAATAPRRRSSTSLLLAPPSLPVTEEDGQTGDIPIRHTLIAAAAPRLQISSGNERRLLLNSSAAATPSPAPADGPAARGESREQKARRLRGVYDKLALQGFSSAQIEQALSARDTDWATFESALDWLCFNLPGDEPPLKFLQQWHQHHLLSRSHRCYSESCAAGYIDGVCCRSQRHISGTKSLEAYLWERQTHTPLLAHSPAGDASVSTTFTTTRCILTAVADGTATNGSGLVVGTPGVGEVGCETRWPLRQAGLGGNPAQLRPLWAVSASSHHVIISLHGKINIEFGAEQERTQLTAVGLQAILAFAKRGNLQTEFFSLGPNQYLVTSIHENWFCARCVNSTKSGGEGVIIMQIGAYLLVSMYDGSLASASQAMVSADQFAMQFSLRTH